jgi:hypothetical protein
MHHGIAGPGQNRIHRVMERIEMQAKLAKRRRQHEQHQQYRQNAVFLGPRQQTRRRQRQQPHRDPPAIHRRQRDQIKNPQEQIDQDKITQKINRIAAIHR